MLHGNAEFWYRDWHRDIIGAYPDKKSEMTAGKTTGTWGQLFKLWDLC